MPRQQKKGSEAGNRRPRRSRRSESDENNADDNHSGEEPRQDNNQARSVASHVRERHRSVAEREAARLAKPEARPKATLAHADRKKSAVTSTPFGALPKPANVGNAEEWCGPFSVARQIVAEREEAKRRQEEEDEAEGQQQHPLDEAMMELEQERKRKLHPSIQWKSTVTIADEQEGGSGDDASPSKKNKKMPSLYAARKQRAGVGKRGISSLFDLCINFLVENFDHVESVGFVDASIRKRLAHELVGRNTLDNEALQALAVPGMEALEIVDASSITSEALAVCLGSLLPAGLRYLSLDQCGRCFGPKAAQLVVESASSTPLTIQALAIGGAYLLKDENAASLVTGLEKTLQSIEFKACPLVGPTFCKSLSEVNEIVLRELSLEDLTFSDEAWSALVSVATSSTFWKEHLESLKLRRMEGLSDDRMKAMLAYPTALAALDVGLNHQLTDMTLSHIRSSPSALSELCLTGLKGLTSSGLEALFTPVPEMGPPPRLRSCDVGHCDHEAVTDTVVELVALASCSSPAASSSETASDALNLKKPPTRLRSLAPSFGLAHLNIQGANKVTDSSLETLVKACGLTLQELNVSFCPQFTDQGMGYFVDNCGSQFKTLDIWGLAQISEVFLDGHRRIKDPTLQISGAWMKKNSVTIR